MATILAADAKRTDSWMVNPNDILMKEDTRGRWAPPTPEEIMERALSMLELGQLQEVECRKLADNKLLLTAGFTRCAAARLIRAGFTDTEGVFHQEAEFRLRVKIVNCNDEEAFIRNVMENQERNQTSPIDDAHNHERGRRLFGYSDADIAKKLKCNPSKVSTLKKLLGLKKEIKELVHLGKMTVQAALDLLDVPEDQHAEIIANSTKEGNGKIDTTKVRAQVRDHHLADVDADEKIEASKDGPQDDDSPMKVKSRNMREMKNFFESLTQDEDAVVVNYAKVMLAFIKGKKTVKMAVNALRKLRD